VFYAFDLLWLDGEDLRAKPLIERKRKLKRLLPPPPSSPILYAQHVERTGIEFYRLACDRDLEGVVAKLKRGVYGQGWFKIRNPRYSQYEGRQGLFERRTVAATASV
jgi:bifunctional non-homologous end joining protein LigD